MDKYVVIDLETSGRNSKIAEVIEVSALKVYMGEVIDSFSTLIKPSAPIDPESAAVNGITDDMVVNSPAITDILPSLKSFLDGECLMGYNISSFDFPILRRIFASNTGNQIENDYIDVLYLAKSVLPDLPDHKLCTVANYFGIPTEGAHRSLNDCYMTLECYKKLQELPAASAKNRVSKVSASDITPTRTHFDTSHPLYKKRCVFTGELQSLSRREAAQLVVDAGGIFQISVSRHTDFLFVGKQKPDSSEINSSSSKVASAYSYQQNGSGINILTEDDFLDMYRNKHTGAPTSLFHGKPYIPFGSPAERDEFLKKYGLLSQKPRKQKVFFYKGREVLFPTICDIVGYVQEYSSSATLAIDYGCGTDFILSDFLKQMQLYSFSMNNLGEAK